MSACGAAAASSAWSRMSTTATSVFESARERERGCSSAAALVFFFDERTAPAVRTIDLRKSDLAIAFHLFEGIGIEVGFLVFVVCASGVVAVGALRNSGRDFWRAARAWWLRGVERECASAVGGCVWQARRRRGRLDGRARLSDRVKSGIAEPEV